MEHPSDATLELKAMLGAPRERVFALLTEPAELAKWWGPRGFTTPEIQLELRVGGRYRFTMKPPEGDVFHLSGEYLEIDQPHRLAFTFRWDEPTPTDRETVATISLRERPSGTELALSQGPFATAERVALHRDGWSDSLEKLRALVEEGARPPR